MFHARSLPPELRRPRGGCVPIRLSARIVHTTNMSSTDSKARAFRVREHAVVYCYIGEGIHARPIPLRASYVCIYRTNSRRSLVSSNRTLPPCSTLATCIATGRSPPPGLVVASGFGFVANSTAAGTTPASVSAISLTSSLVSTPATLTPLLDMSKVAGPRNCRKSRSPHIERRALVRRAKRKRARNLQVSVPRTTPQNRTSLSGIISDDILATDAGTRGACSRTPRLLSRNGRGGFLLTE